MREWDLDLGKASRRHAHARQTAPTEAHVALQLWITRSSERCSARWCRALPIPRHARAHALHRRLGLKKVGPRSQVCPALGPPCAPARTSLPCHAVERASTHTRIPAQRVLKGGLRLAGVSGLPTSHHRSAREKKNRQTAAPIFGHGWLIKTRQTDRPWHGRELTKTRAVKHPRKRRLCGAERSYVRTLGHAPALRVAAQSGLRVCCNGFNCLGWAPCRALLVGRRDSRGRAQMLSGDLLASSSGPVCHVDDDHRAVQLTARRVSVGEGHECDRRADRDDDRHSASAAGV